jgi:hypothetical protein
MMSIAPAFSSMAKLAISAWSKQPVVGRKATGTFPRSRDVPAYILNYPSAGLEQGGGLARRKIGTVRSLVKVQ